MTADGISILQSLIDPGRGDFTPDVARYFLALDFSPEQHAVHERLSAKAAEGTLTGVEAAELDELLAASALLSVLQSKARLSLLQKAPAA